MIEQDCVICKRFAKTELGVCYSCFTNIEVDDN